MKTLLFLLLVSLASAETLNQQLRDIAKNADRVELSWRVELDVQVAGVVPFKKAYAGGDVEKLLSAIVFVDDVAKKEESSCPPGAIWVGNCGCIGSHVLRFFAGDQLLSEISFHHGTHLRAKALNRGRDAVLTEASQKWLQLEADWIADLTKIKEYKLRKIDSNQSTTAQRASAVVDR